VNAGTAVVVHVRDRWPRDETTTKLARAWVSRRATGVIANSAFTLDGFVEGISAPGAAAVIHNGVDVDVFDPRRVDGSEARACFAMPATALVMGMAAHMTPWKGQADAIRMVDQLVRSGVDVRLLMAGSVKFQHPGARHDHARYVRDVAGLVRNSVAPDRIHLVGEVADMPTFYAACDVVLVPSLHEPFGRVVIEAMAMARCVVASQNGGPAEIITDGIDGFLLAPGEPEAWADRVGELAADSRLRGRIGAAARETARRSFSSERHADRVAAWYDRLTSPR
jgi:glycosyltransferase involved in cell wall biosynthesis